MRLIRLGLLVFLVAACRINGEKPNGSSARDVDGDGITAATDCDDDDPEVGGETEFFLDQDGDGFGADSTTTACEAPSGHVKRSDDCDDRDEDVYPDAQERCNGQDDDCDGVTDEPDAPDAGTWFEDADDDGFGDAASTVSACSRPTGFVPDDSDCDDGDDGVHPGADEMCDGVDENCDGVIDDGALDMPSWFTDGDGDGFGDPYTQLRACNAPSAWIDQSGDCDDDDDTVHPNATEMCDGIDNNCDQVVDTDAMDRDVWCADVDGDGYGDATDCLLACSVPDGYVDDDTDCDDAVFVVHPFADEVCDGRDNDCDNTIDQNALDPATWYLDADGDGYGLDGSTTLACVQPSGFGQYPGDCDDGNSNIHPDAAETDCTDPVDYNCDGSAGFADVDGDGFAACLDCDDGDADVNTDGTEMCDGIDNDCDGTVDEPDAVDAGRWFDDEDGDGYGGLTKGGDIRCGPELGQVDNGIDCDDTNPLVNPGMPEVCNGQDDDCDGVDTNAVDAPTWFHDWDGDGYGDDTDWVMSCTQFASNFTLAAGDCDDNDADVNPDATEVCDGVDNDCDGRTDIDPVGPTPWFLDTDGDGYGDPDSWAAECVPPNGYVANSDDCNDTVVDQGVLPVDIHPGATEIDDNGVDDDCDGITDIPDALPGGFITTDTVWDAANGPYLVEQNILVESGVTLTIEPCVQILFEAGTTLQVEGTLIARGQPGCRIQLTSARPNPAPGDWARLYFTSTAVGATINANDDYVAGSILEYVDVFYGGSMVAGVHAEGPGAPYFREVDVAWSARTGIRTRGTVARVFNTTVRYNRFDGVGTQADDILIDGLVAFDNGGGVSIDSHQTARVLRSTILDNYTGLTISGVGGTVAHCEVSGSQDGLWLHSNQRPAFDIHDNVISGNVNGIRGDFATGTYKQNLLLGNTTAIRAENKGLYTVSENIFVGNGDALRNQVNAGNSTSNNTFFWNESAQASVSGSGAAVFDWNHNLIQRHMGPDYAVQWPGGQPTGSGGVTFANNNFIGPHDEPELMMHVGYSAGSPTMKAENNWWGVMSAGEIGGLVYDFLDDAAYAVADFDPWLSEPNLDAPISVPTGLLVSRTGGTLNISWIGNPEADVRGYRVYYGAEEGWELMGTGADQGASGIDAGNVTGFRLTGLDPTLAWRVSITAYDADADGTDDLWEGHESWYAPPMP